MKKLILTSLIIFFMICSKSWAEYNGYMPGADEIIVMLIILIPFLAFSLSGGLSGLLLLPFILFGALGIYKLIIKPIFIFLVIDPIQEGEILESIGLWLFLLFMIAIFLEWLRKQYKNK